ncbi:MAG: GDP-mannose 4,6-dehydratase [Patescibacteria group bacterium]
MTGQDGAYLAELLLDKGYEVHGLQRRASLFNTGRIDKLLQGERKSHIKLHFGDVTDGAGLSKLFSEIKPDEVYNLAAQSHVRLSFDMPEYTAQTDAVGVLHLLEAIRVNGLEKHTRFYQASTSEMFGGVGYNMPDDGYTEESPFHPRSPYGVAKLYGFWIVSNYRESYDMFACNGLLFNHESPLRGENFVTRKITRAVAQISLGQLDKMEIGNLDAKRDWGHAKDYVEAMWLMLQQDKPEDFVIAMGETNTVRDFINWSFKEVGVDIEWKGTGIDEIGVDSKTGKVLVSINPKFFRPAEVDLLLGNPAKAKRVLGWKPKYTLASMISEMVRLDLEDAKKIQILKDNGFEVLPQFE